MQIFIFYKEINECIYTHTYTPGGRAPTDRDIYTFYYNYLLNLILHICMYLDLLVVEQVER